jgi:hypothetical protein
VVVEARGHRASGVEERGIGRGIELWVRRMVPELTDDVEQAIARADRGERLMAVSCGALVTVTAMVALRRRRR